MTKRNALIAALGALLALGGCSSTSDRESLLSLPRSKLQAGSSEILNWITAGGALEGLRMELIDYIPGYRSEGGTGVGMAFAKWL